MQRRTLTSLVSTLVLATALPASVLAQTYPSKPIKFIVPYAAGGLPDTVARVVALRLTERLGQSVVVDNKPGGNGVVAYQALLQSSPQDGHAFIVSDGSMLSITPLLNKNATYKPGWIFCPSRSSRDRPFSSWRTLKQGSIISKIFSASSKANLAISLTDLLASAARTI